MIDSCVTIEVFYDCSRLLLSLHFTFDGHVQERSIGQRSKIKAARDYCRSCDVIGRVTKNPRVIGRYILHDGQEVSPLFAVRCSAYYVTNVIIYADPVATHCDSLLPDCLFLFPLRLLFFLLLFSPLTGKH